jgi:outer membrane protein TolC
MRLRFSLFLAFGVGCAGTRTPLPDGACIREVIERPALPPAPPAADLPPPPSPNVAKQSQLALDDVLASVGTNFPLLLAIEQERTIANGQRLSAEGAFDTVLRARGSDQNGSFSNGRLDVSAEQPVLSNGASVFAGWRLGDGNFPIYYGDRKTADGGEFRAGFTIPLFRDRPIDRRRVALRQAQIQEQLADPTIRRARLDAFRSAAQTYWLWVAAGEQYRITQELLKLAQNRQTFLDEQFRGGLVGETVPALNQRLVAARGEATLAAERQLQQAAIRLSLFLRDAAGDPVVPQAGQLPAAFFDAAPAPPNPAQLQADVQAALGLRPELERFRLLKERAGTDLALARNRTLPGVNLFAAAAQDVGNSKKTFIGTGPFATDRTNAEFGVTFELEAQRREALGRLRTAQGQLAQLLAQERYARDDITAQVQDAISELVQTYERLGKAREEYKQAGRVLDLETESFRRQRTSLVDLNLQEIAAAEAQVKVAALLGAYYRAVAEYLAAVGVEAAPTAPPTPRP